MNNNSMAEEQTLFELPPSIVPEPEIKSQAYPLWTESKAKLIAKYLHLFVLITKHGTYIDCFAGPQADEPGMWAAEQVLKLDPPWLRHFHLFELADDRVAALERLGDAHPDRDVVLHPGDVNTTLPQFLSTNPIGEKEATFCLFDQRTFECKWRTVKAVANYGPRSHKIELFYFLANAWFGRALSACRTQGIQQVREWWGRDDWEKLAQENSINRAQLFCSRMREELGYASAKPWPIYKREEGRRIMYYMIHASDHREAPKLMARAYEASVRAVEEVLEQLKLTLPEPGG